MDRKNNLEFIRDVSIKGQLPETFGIDIIEAGKSFIVGQLKVDQRHLRPGNVMNGGVSLVLIETVGSISSYLYIDPKRQNAFGIQVSANHLAIARHGDVLTARSSAVHIGRTTQVWEVEIKNQNDKIVSSGRITLLVTEIRENP
jgi:1,4-dihydroxy-2-naphthoyl-CoA hydrolase